MKDAQNRKLTDKQISARRRSFAQVQEKKRRTHHKKEGKK